MLAVQGNLLFSTLILDSVFATVVFNENTMQIETSSPNA